MWYNYRKKRKVMMNMKNRPIWQKFYICCLVCVLATVSVISAVYLTQFWLEKKDIVDENIENVLYFADSEIKGELDSIRNLFGSMTVARSIKTAVESGIQYRDGTMQVMSTLYADSSKIRSVFFVDKNKNHYSVGEVIGGLDERMQIIDRAKKSKSFGENNYTWFYGKTELGNNLCILYQKIIFLNEELNKEYLGEILVCVDSAKISDNYFKGLSSDTGIVFTDEYGFVTASSVTDWIGQPFDEIFVTEGNTLSDNSHIKYSFKKIPSMVKSWECISLVNHDLVMSKTKGMVALVIFIGVLCCIIIGFVSYKITYGIGRPIGQLLNYVKVSDAGEIVFENIDKNDEVLVLKNVFDSMSEKLKSETEVRFHKEEQLRLAQIKAFEEQVNPHFLYNTLQIIQMLSVMNRNDDVQSVITYLGKMLRFNLDSRNEILLGEEIENVENYFKILKFRYTDGFDYKLHISDELKKLKSIKFLLQPFVENAFKHGFKDKTGLWEIAIIAVEYSDEIAIVIRDNGTGIEPQRLSELKAVLADNAQIPSGGVGIRNVNERIKLYYGKRYGVDIFCGKNNTQIVIHIPKISDTESEDTVNV